MNKGLEALEILKHTTDLDRPNELNGYKEELDIIEKELKRLEDIDGILNTGGGIWAENGIVSKKLKAFEIIKNHIKISLSFYDGNEEHTRYSAEMSEFNITPEQRNLLKEVLKDE